jgi:hypothetical protein
MPKQIKKEKITKSERNNRIWAILAMVSAFLFGAALILFMKDFINNESLWRGLVIVGTYSLYTLLAIVHCLHGFNVFRKEEHYGVLFQSILTAAAAFAALLSGKFAVVMTLSALGKDTAAQNLIGSDTTMDDFVLAQSTAWILLICGIAAVILVGIISIVRLAKTTH